MEKKVTVRGYTDEKYFDLIEVNESEIEAVRQANKLTWHDTNAENYRRRILKENGIIICSLDCYQEDNDCIEDESVLSPEDQMIEEEENKEKYLLLQQLLQSLNENQRKIIEMRFFNDMKFADIASELGVSIGTVQVHLSRSLKKMKNFYEKCLKTPQKFTFIDEGVKNLSNTRRAN